MMKMASAQLPPANGLRSGTATIAKGQRRVDKVLRAARKILALEGYPNFTMRNVAARSGISLGNLQYYFPTKNALLRELIEYNEKTHDVDYKAIFVKADNPEDCFYALVDYLLDDLEKPLVRGFLFQVWALTTHDDYVETCMEKAFAHYRSVVSRAIAGLNPRMSKVERARRAAAIQSIIEGSQLTRVKQGKRFVQRPGLRKLIRSEAFQIVIR